MHVGPLIMILRITFCQKQKKKTKTKKAPFSCFSSYTFVQHSPFPRPGQLCYAWMLLYMDVALRGFPDSMLCLIQGAHAIQIHWHLYLMKLLRKVCCHLMALHCIFTAELIALLPFLLLIATVNSLLDVLFKWKLLETLNFGYFCGALCNLKK